MLIVMHTLWISGEDETKAGFRSGKLQAGEGVEVLAFPLGDAGVGLRDGGDSEALLAQEGDDAVFAGEVGGAYAGEDGGVAGVPEEVVSHFYVAGVQA